MLKLSELKTLSSPQLINLLSNHGYGQAYYGELDTRYASIKESGKFTHGKLKDKYYVKIVVLSDNKETYDYGVRLWIDAYD